MNQIHSADTAKIENRKQPPLETELKFVQDSCADKQTKRSLENICRPDESFQQNIIFSVYFDTYDWYFAMEKASSDYIKTKVRVRWYKSLEENSSQSPCFLEIKQKIGSKRRKQRFNFPANGENISEMLMNEDCLNFLRGCVSKTLPELSGFPLEPKMLVTYTRNRYYEPLSQTRVAFDTNIQGMIVEGGTLTNRRRVKLPTSVLEVKGFQEELPYAFRNIHSVNMKKASFSKYYECFLQLTDYQQ